MEEEEEEEEVFEEDQVVEVEVEAEEEPEFPDFTTTEHGREVSTRRRRPKRTRSNPPIAVNLVPRRPVNASNLIKNFIEPVP